MATIDLREKSSLRLWMRSFWTILNEESNGINPKTNAKHALVGM